MGRVYICHKLVPRNLVGIKKLVTRLDFKRARISNFVELVTILTCNSLMATHELLGNPWSIGTRNCRQPLQWPIRSIMQIRLKIRMNTDAIFRNCQQQRQRFILVPASGARMLFTLQLKTSLVIQSSGCVVYSK